MSERTWEVQILTCATVCADLKRAGAWPQRSASGGKICLSYLKIEAVPVKRMQTQCSSLPSCFTQSGSKPRVRQTKEKQKGNTCITQEPDVTLQNWNSLLLKPPSPLFPCLLLSHRGWIVLRRLGRGHGWEKCRGGS